MSSTLQWCFEPFRLDPVNACLWRGGRMLALRPKPFAVLAYLVGHAGQLVTKGALFEAIWPETVVSDTVLKACIRQIRQVLGDTARTSQFILTVHRRGYRFIAPVTEVNQTPDIPIEPITPLATDDVPALAQPSARRTSGTFIDRDAQLRQLHARLAAAARGERQILFVTGEPGIGKTALLETFTEQAAADPHVRLAWGQCVEHYGAAEAYMPVLEALAQFCRGSDSAHILTVLRQQAPTLKSPRIVYTGLDRS